MDEQIVADPVPVQFKQQSAEDALLILAARIHRERGPDLRERLRLVDVTVESYERLPRLERAGDGAASNGDQFPSPARAQLGHEGCVKTRGQVEARPEGWRVDIVDGELRAPDQVPQTSESRLQVFLGDVAWALPGSHV